MSGLEQAKAIIQKWQTTIKERIICSQINLDLISVCLLSRGHLLLEDVPGLGKTTLAKSIAQSLALQFKRVQCTPDLLPSDITGITVFDPAAQSFKFLPGPIFTQILLADEINRTSPRTQSALLEAMAERSVTVDRKTHSLSKSFMVIATQNPVEFSGTYPLPEAQLDRFLMRLSLGYPSKSDEAKILAMHVNTENPDDLKPVMEEKTLVSLQAMATKIKIEKNLQDYALSLAEATRTHTKIRLGVSPRAMIALLRAAQSMAMINARGYVTAQDIQLLIKPIWAHRMIIRSAQDSVEKILDEILQAKQVPAMPDAASGKTSLELS